MPKQMHTPGPWKYLEVQRKNGLIGFEIRTTDGSEAVICEIDAKPYLVHVREDNAALIAAAPELLEACKASLALYERLKEASVIPIGGKIETDYNSLKQAIAKAEGRSYA